jgi:hypothetical protein
MHRVKYQAYMVSRLGVTRQTQLATLAAASVMHCCNALSITNKANTAISPCMGFCNQRSRASIAFELLHKRRAACQLVSHGCMVLMCHVRTMETLCVHACNTSAAATQAIKHAALASN